MTKKAAEIAAVKDDAEKDLAAAKPALDAALAALNSITPKDIVGLKALKNPPDVVKRIFDCVLLLRYMPVDKVRRRWGGRCDGRLPAACSTTHPPPTLPPPLCPQVSWQDVKGAMVILGTYSEAVKMMGDMNFLGALVNFAKEQINDETVELLQPYFAAPDFNFESARKASGGWRRWRWRRRWWWGCRGRGW